MEPFGIESAGALLLEITRQRTPSFSGLGLLVYAPPLRLPVGPLGDIAAFPSALPAHGCVEIARILADASTLDSPWHDGFHLIDGAVGSLTHICQFFAPPIDALPSVKPGQRPIGARHAAAVAGSTLDGVICTALVSAKGDAQIFAHGQRSAVSVR